jgi:hypothetical protein
VKCRGNGFRELYRWLNGADLLIVKANHSEPLVILRLKLASEIAAIAEHIRVDIPAAECPASFISGNSEKDHDN